MLPANDNAPTCSSFTIVTGYVRTLFSNCMEFNFSVRQDHYGLTPLGKDRFQALKNHYVATRLTTRQHGNHNRIPHNALSFSDVKNVVRFLQAYSEDNAILLPGRIPGYKRDDIQLLPSNTTKKV